MKNNCVGFLWSITANSLYLELKCNFKNRIVRISNWPYLFTVYKKLRWVELEIREKWYVFPDLAHWQQYSVQVLIFECDEQCIAVFNQTYATSVVVGVKITCICSIPPLKTSFLYKADKICIKRAVNRTIICIYCNMGCVTVVVLVFRIQAPSRIIQPILQHTQNLCYLLRITIQKLMTGGPAVSFGCSDYRMIAATEARSTENIKSHAEVRA